MLVNLYFFKIVVITQIEHMMSWVPGLHANHHTTGTVQKWFFFALFTNMHNMNILGRSYLSACFQSQTTGQICMKYGTNLMPPIKPPEQNGERANLWGGSNISAT